MYDRIAHTNLILAKLHSVRLSVFALSWNRPFLLYWAVCCLYGRYYHWNVQLIILTKNSVQSGIDPKLLTESSSIFWSMWILSNFLTLHLSLCLHVMALSPWRYICRYIYICLKVILKNDACVTEVFNSMHFKWWQMVSCKKKE